MRALRIALLSALGLIVSFAHGLVVVLIEFMVKPYHQDMLGFGIFLRCVDWGFILVLPLCIGLGELWFKDLKRYIPHVLLLTAFIIWSANVWPIHPNRTLLLLTFAFLTLPLRWLIDRTFVSRSVG